MPALPPARLYYHLIFLLACLLFLARHPFDSRTSAPVSRPKLPKPLHPPRRNFNPPQRRHALRPPPIDEIITLRHNIHPLRQRPPRISRSHYFFCITPAFRRIPWCNLIIRTRVHHNEPGLCRSRESRWTKLAPIASIETRPSSARPICIPVTLRHIEKLAPFQAELEREHTVGSRCSGERFAAIRARSLGTLPSCFFEILRWA
jgi:hypothetical protein